jgi:hypothetical protein
MVGYVFSVVVYNVNQYSKYGVIGYMFSVAVYNVNQYLK